jgi:hypothetical protein
MAYIEHNKLQDYPYFGQFFRIEIDESKPLDEQIEERVVIFETDCDITESSHSWSRNFIWAKYAIYFPFDKDTEEIEVKLGDLFEADMHGLIVNGKVVGVFPSQLGGVTVYVQDTDV